MKRLNESQLFGNTGVAHPRNDGFVRPEFASGEITTILELGTVSHTGCGKQ